VAAEVDRTLTQWLGCLSAEELARVIANRPEALRSPWPRHLRALATLLADPGATTGTIRRLPRPAVQMLHAMAVLPSGATRRELAGLLGVEVADADLAEVLAGLAQHALAWETPQGRLVQAPGVREGWRYPLGLGRPAADFFHRLDFERIKGVARLLGLPLGGGKQAVTDRITEFFQDHRRLRDLVASGPQQIGELLAAFATEGPVRSADGVSSYYSSGAPMTPARWAVERGLLWAQDWRLAEMPREVALSLRGPDYHAPFTPQPPQITTFHDDPGVVDAEAAAAASHLLDRAGALLDLAGRTPVGVIKTGGVGAREIRRLAKALSCSPDEIRVLLEVAFSAGLLAFTDKGLASSGSWEEWTAQPSAVRLSRLIAAWWSTQRGALLLVDGGQPAALADQEHGEIAREVRQAALTVLAGLAPGEGATELTDSLAWVRPLYPRDLVQECLQPVLVEARLLGLVGRDTASGLGRALAGGGEVVVVAEGMLAVACPSALFGADLTAVVPGPPAAELARLLDRVADRETRGTASVWRFSPGSVRRALDGGLTEGQLLSDLRTVAHDGLPQPLEYLIKDMARRHGEVCVAEVACVVRGHDEGLLAEIASHRKLARLGLRVLAPTVLASDASLATTLAALREVGYSPVAAGGDGAPVIGRDARSVVQASQAAPSVTGGRSGTPQTTLSAQELAGWLLSRALPEPPSELQVQALIAKHAGQLPGTERFNLYYLVQYGLSTYVEARLDDETTGRWTLEKGELDGDVLDAWCPATDSYQRVRLSLITKARR
jgi:hypothetical protein